MSLTGNLPVDIQNYRFVGPAGLLPSGTQVGSTDYALTHVQLYAADGTVLIGQKTMSASIPVAIASNQGALPLPAGGTPTAGSRSLTTTSTFAVASSSVPCKQVVVQNPYTNSVDIVLGDASTQTIRLRPGEAITVPVSNVNLLYATNVSSTTQTINWLAVN